MTVSIVDKAGQLHALLDLIRMPAVRDALERAPVEIQRGICCLASGLQTEAFNDTNAVQTSA